MVIPPGRGYRVRGWFLAGVSLTRARSSSDVFAAELKRTCLSKIFTPPFTKKKEKKYIQAVGC